MALFLKNKYLIFIKMILIFNKKYDTIELHLKRKGVCIMNMKITKKILAGTLVLMNTFTAVSAEPVKSETLSSDSTSVNNKNPEGKSTKKKLAKGVAIAAGGAAAVAAVGGAIALIRNIFKTREIEENWDLSDVSRRVLWFYLTPEVRECVERNKDTKLGEALAYLFDVLDGIEPVDKLRLIGSFECVNGYTGVFRRKYEFGCNELDCVLRESLSKGIPYYDVEYLALDDISNKYFQLSGLNDSYMYGIYTDGIDDFSECKDNIMNVNPSDGSSSYSLKMIVVCDGNTIYVKCKDDRWRVNPFDGIKEKPLDDNSMLKKCSHRKVRLFYVKSNQQCS